MSDDTLDEAWRAAEAVTPKDATLQLERPYPGRYETFLLLGEENDGVVVLASAGGDTAVGALRRLVSVVRVRGSR